MIGGGTVNIGGRASFSIVPNTPGAVYFTTHNCQVMSAVDSNISYNLIYSDNQDQERCDDATAVSLDSVGWSTSAQQDFSYIAFRFSAPGSVFVESQKIQCEINLSISEDTDYNPSHCGYNPPACPPKCTCWNGDGTCCSSEAMEESEATGKMNCVSSMTLVGEEGVILNPEVPVVKEERFDLLKHNSIETEIMIGDSNDGRKRRDVDAEYPGFGYLFHIQRDGDADDDDCDVSVGFNPVTTQFLLKECLNTSYGNKNFFTVTDEVPSSRKRRSLVGEYGKFKVGKEKLKSGVEELYIFLDGAEVYRKPVNKIPEDWKKAAIKFCKKSKGCTPGQVKNLNIKNFIEY